jgi:hypothetical protein
MLPNISQPADFTRGADGEPKPYRQVSGGILRWQRGRVVIFMWRHTILNTVAAVPDD